jgi:ribulose-phosphate 3-epimerase
VAIDLATSRRVAPSILSADFSRLGEQIGEVMDAGARVIHVDVMDGHFVPPITIGSLVVASISEQIHEAGGHVDVHLMIERPEEHVAEFAEAGADSISIHQEATAHVHYALKIIREAGCAAGLALTPATPPEAASEVLDTIDILLCMTVNPGWGGQEYIPHSTAKIARLREMLPDNVALEVDGGIDLETGPGAAAAGANLFVAGSHVFGTADPADAYVKLAAAVGAD